MDYSVLVGVHFREVSQDKLPTEGHFQTQTTHKFPCNFSAGRLKNSIYFVYSWW